MRPLFTLLILLQTALTSFAEFKFPPGVYREGQLDEAMNEATKQKKPLYLVMGEETRTEENHQDLLQEELKAGSDWSVVVFITLSNQFSLPPPMLAVLTKGYPPMVFVATPEGDKIFKVISQPKRNDPTAPLITAPVMRKHLRLEIAACKPEIAAWFAAKPPHGPELPGEREFTWPKARGNTGEIGVFDKLKDEKVYFRGTPETIYSGTPINDFKPATVRYLRYITGTGAAAKPAEPAKPAPAVEKWTNAQGKTIEAAFLSLKDGKVKLRTAAGKEHLLALNTLSAESQKRAKELAGGEAKKE